MWIIYALLVLVAFLLCSIWCAICYAIYCAIKPKPKPGNPYKEAHLLWEKNEENFEAYIDWLRTTKRNGVPLGKVKSHSEKEIDSKINKLL